MSASPEASEHPEPSPVMTPGAFIAKWRASELKDRSASQEYFTDLCRLLGEPTRRAREVLVRARRTEDSGEDG